MWKPLVFLALHPTTVVGAARRCAIAGLIQAPLPPFDLQMLLNPARHIQRERRLQE
jgi:hypothetical protein